MLVLGLCGYFFLGASGKEKIGWETDKSNARFYVNMVSANRYRRTGDKSRCRYAGIRYYR